LDARQVFRQGKWWYQQPDGAWLVWDDSTGKWNAAPGPPPPERPVATYQSSRSQRLWAMSMLSIVVLADAVAVVFDLMEWSLLRRIASGASIAAADAEASDVRQAAMGVLQFSVHVATGIAFIAWFHRSYANVAALAPERARYRPGWAIGGWLLPILHLFRPKQIANDIWWATTSPPGNQRVSSLLQWWWGVWLISQQLDIRAAARSLGAETLDELRTSSAFWIAADATSVGAGVLAILVVMKLSRLIHAKAIETGVDAAPF